MLASPIPQTWYAYLITLPHLGIAGSRYKTLTANYNAERVHDDCVTSTREAIASKEYYRQDQ